MWYRPLSLTNQSIWQLQCVIEIADLVMLINAVACRDEYINGVFWRTSSGLPRVPDDIPFGATQVHLESNEIEEINQLSFRHLTRVTHIYLDSNRISSIQATTFNTLSKLIHLYMSHNRLTAVNREWFTGLSSLKVLKIEGNLFRSLEAETFKDLTSLSHLYLSNNDFQSLDPRACANLASLTYLALDSADLDSSMLAPKMFNGMTKLVHLVLRNNHLDTVPWNVFSPSDFRGSGGHPPSMYLYLNGNPFICSTLCWIKHGEQEKWLRFTSTAHAPQCTDSNDAWASTQLSCPSMGM